MMNTSQKLIALLSGAALLSVSSLAAQTATTAPVGYVTTTISSGYNTIGTSFAKALVIKNINNACQFVFRNIENKRFSLKIFEKQGKMSPNTKLVFEQILDLSNDPEIKNGIRIVKADILNQKKNLMILSTSKGLLTIDECKQAQIGGKLLLFVK